VTAQPGAMEMPVTLLHKLGHDEMASFGDSAGELAL
jgi:hypothetical protein